VLLRDGEGRMCGAEIAFCQLPHILLICTGLWRGPSRLTGGSRCPRPSAACPRCSLCRAGTGWVGEAGDCGRWGGGIRAYTCGVLAVLLTAMHHDANIVLEHKEALDATGRRTRRGHGQARTAYDDIRVGCYRCLRHLLLDHVVHPLLPNCGRI